MSASIDAAGANHGKSAFDLARDLESSQMSLEQSIEATAFLQSVLDSTADCLKVLTLSGEIVFMNKGGREVMEVDDFETIRGCSWPGFWEGTDKSAAQAALDAARAGRIGKFQGSAATAKGRPKYWDVTVTRIAGRNGHQDHILSISRDITAAKEIEAQKDLLSREMGHRIKNSLSIVQAIAFQTFRGVDPEMLNDFSSRLAALGAAQALLLQSNWEHVSLRDLILQTLTPMCPPERLRLAIDALGIDGPRALALALALHELGTNAVKYGALSNDQGSVDVTLEQSADEFRLVWQETGGPPVIEPTLRGFGTLLMTRNLESDLGGKVELNFRADGVVWSLTAPR